MAERLSLPGFVDAHSHAFQRALRGAAAGRDFWEWREVMLAEAARQTATTVRAEYQRTFAELVSAGYTAVGEFHYLGFEEALAAADAAGAAGIELVLLHAAYARGGLDRFRQESLAAYLREVEALQERGIRVGLAPHSVRACPVDWLREIGRYAASTGLPLHVHACEQPKEVDECIAEHALSPIALLAEAGCLSPRTTVVHATHADDAELDLIAEAGARVCICPTTEANLADGFAPVVGLLERGIPVCIGSDSNIRIDPLEELRELDGIARRQTLRRDVLTEASLLEIGTTNGAASLGLDRWEGIEVRVGHPCLDGVAREHLVGALLAGCSADAIL
jgi:formimidoylglutamate deiminase